MPRNADSRSSSTTWRRLNPPEAESHRPTVARSCAVESRLSAAGTFGMDSVETRSVPQIGWIAVPRYGSAVVGQITVRLGASDGTLERRAQFDQATAELRVAELAANAGVAAAKAAGTAAAEFRAALDAARAHEAAATGERRRAEEAERLAARRLEAGVREAAWHAAQLERLTGEVERARAAVPSVVTPAPPSTNLGERDALATWQARVVTLRGVERPPKRRSAWTSSASRQPITRRLRSLIGIEHSRQSVMLSPGVWRRRGSGRRKRVVPSPRSWPPTPRIGPVLGRRNEPPRPHGTDCAGQRMARARPSTVTWRLVSVLGRLGR